MAAIDQAVLELTAAFREGRTLPVEWRKKQLKQLWHLISVC
jgi:acyl-CoA reductase-like NAD-dependent aldehyde dehydrogenase